MAFLAPLCTCINHHADFMHWHGPSPPKTRSNDPHLTLHKLLVCASGALKRVQRGSLVHQDCDFLDLRLQFEIERLFRSIALSGRNGKRFATSRCDFQAKTVLSAGIPTIWLWRFQIARDCLRCTKFQGGVVQERERRANHQKQAPKNNGKVLSIKEVFIFIIFDLAIDCKETNLNNKYIYIYVKMPRCTRGQRRFRANFPCNRRDEHMDISGPSDPTRLPKGKLKACDPVFPLERLEIPNHQSDLES